MTITNMDDRAENMVAVAGGSFLMGSDRFYPEERPVRKVSVASFLMDRTPVTNARFACFVQETGYVTTAERAPDPAAYPGVNAALLRAGSLVFRKTDGLVDLREPHQWWAYCIGANWRRPLGPGSDLAGLDDHPVVHVTTEDAQTYATWAGKRLPSEAEWEYAARGGLDGADFAWGDELAPGGRMLANYWQGAFPWQNTLEDGYERTSPVMTYPANPYGLFDLIGNVWEWTADWYREGALSGGDGVRSCCVPRGRAAAEESYDPAIPHLRIPRRVIKGGSHLCAANYCQRYRPAARHPQTIDTSTSHLGFRCVL